MNNSNETAQARAVASKDAKQKKGKVVKLQPERPPEREFFTQKYNKKSDEWSYVYSHLKVKKWLESEGFFKSLRGDNVLYYKEKSNILEPYLDVQIKDVVLVKSKDLEPQLNNEVVKQFSRSHSSFIQTLETKEIKNPPFTKGLSWLFYKNGALKITPDNAELIPYKKLDFKIYKDDIKDREFKKCDDVSVFSQFVDKVCDKPDSLKSSIGYLLTPYKNPSTPKYIILNDASCSADSEASGGTGKGLISEAIGYSTNLNSVDGKQFNTNPQFVFQSCKVGDRVFHIEDVQATFKTEILNVACDKGVEVQKKGKTPYKLSKSESPKILVDTNYILEGVGSTFRRRAHNVYLTGVYNENFTPADDFGHLFYEDWDTEEWLKFDNYVVSCAKLYLTKGLIKQDHETEKNQLFLKSTNLSFVDYIDSEKGEFFNNKFLNNERHAVSDAVLFLKGQTSEEGNSRFNLITSKTLKKWLVAYASYVGMTIDTETRLSGRGLSFMFSLPPV